MELIFFIFSVITGKIILFTLIKKYANLESASQPPNQPAVTGNLEASTMSMPTTKHPAKNPKKRPKIRLIVRKKGIMAIFSKTFSTILNK